MDEPQKTPAEPSTPTGAPVMQDVKPVEPKTVPEVSAEVQQSMSANAEPESVVEAPAVSEPPKDAGATSADASQPLPAVTPDPAPAATPAKKSSTAKVVVAMVIALVLIAAAVVVYLGSNSDQTAQKTEDNTPAATTQATPATASDVDQTVNDVDEALSAADAAQDVTSDDLTDTALGL